MHPDALVILNPVAGGGRAPRVWHDAERAMARDGMRAAVCVTQGPGHASELARRACREGVPYVVAVGGDGTVHEVVNGLMAQRAPGCDALPTLVVLPAGTGNDFARNLGFGRNPQAALRTFLAHRATPIDLGRVNDRWYVNQAGLGFDAAVLQVALRLPRGLPGPVSYLAGVLFSVAAFRPPRLRVEIDGEATEGEVFLLTVGNGAQAAGGMKLCPGARLDDGRLDITLIGALRPLEVLRLLPSVFWGGHVHHPRVATRPGTLVVAAGELPLPIQADGELVGSLPARFQVEPGALRVVRPPTPPPPAGADGSLPAAAVPGSRA